MKVPIKISADRVVLRRHTLGDYFPFMRFMEDPDATRYLDFTEAEKTPKRVEELMNSVIESYKSENPIFSLTIADAHTNAYLGSCGLHPHEEGIEMFYTLIPKAQGQGIGTEAVRALVKHTFNEMKARRIVTRIVNENTPALKLAMRLGFVDDGEHSTGVRRLVLTSLQKLH